MKTNNVVFGLSFLGLSIISLAAAPFVSADWLIDRSGTLMQVDGMVLGDDVETQITKQQEGVREVDKDRAERTREKIKQQTELRIKQNAHKVELQKTNTRYDLKNKAGILEVNGEIRNNNDHLLSSPSTRVEGGQPLYIEQEGENGELEKVRINAKKDGRLELIKNRLKTTAGMDLQVGEKNEISVTLPSGKVREIALPDQALAKLTSKGIIAAVEDTETPTDYQLVAGKNGEPVYLVGGKVEKKFLGLFKVKFDQQLEVAASNSDESNSLAGDVVSSSSRETTPWRKLLERLSR